ncbi:type 1 glutamine amidotransferase [Fodinibacter luteus]|uniref:Type 1 glutamine amidotransferase n=1 Tax=Fodinibacter luteus TaxID=552064 RepID=A0ABP8KNZ5_9MICO
MTGVPARLLVVQHEPDAPVGWLGEWWSELGLDLDVVRGDLGEPIADAWGGHGEDAGHDGLVVLGGAMGAGDDAVAPWLAATRGLVADAVARGVPTLGVCLGHQLACVALGGRVGRNPAGRTTGLVPVRLTSEGACDPLLAGLDGLVAVHHNDDVVLDLPPGSTVLATLPDGRPQAVRLGPTAWGVQFHPETSPEVFGSWLRWDSPDGLTGEQEQLLASVGAARETLRASWQPLAERFAALVVDDAAQDAADDAAVRSTGRGSAGAASPVTP